MNWLKGHTIERRISMNFSPDTLGYLCRSRFNESDLEMNTPLGNFSAEIILMSRQPWYRGNCMPVHMMDWRPSWNEPRTLRPGQITFGGVRS